MFGQSVPNMKRHDDSLSKHDRSSDAGRLVQHEHIEYHASKTGTVKNVRTDVPVRVNDANNVLVVVMMCQLLHVRPIGVHDIYLKFVTAMSIGMERKLFTAG